MSTTESKKSAYILMEVIISIIILSFAGISLLKISSNEKRLYSIASFKLEFLKQISIPLNQHSINFHSKNLNIYDLLKRRYDLKNDYLIKELKKTEVHYSQKYKSVINIPTDKKSVNLLIDEIILSNKNGTARFLTIKQ